MVLHLARCAWEVIRYVQYMQYAGGSERLGKGGGRPPSIFQSNTKQSVFSKIVMIANMPDESSTATVGTLICKITEGKGG